MSRIEGHCALECITSLVGTVIPEFQRMAQVEPARCRPGRELAGTFELEQRFVREAAFMQGDAQAGPRRGVVGGDFERALLSDDYLGMMTAGALDEGQHPPRISLLGRQCQGTRQRSCGKVRSMLAQSLVGLGEKACDSRGDFAPRFMPGGRGRRAVHDLRMLRASRYRKEWRK
jgi:hypothetical protein